MDTPANSLIATRGAQMFPTLSPAEVQRLRRFGAVRTYEKGDALVRVGESGHGLTVFLAGEAEITQHDENGTRTHIVTHGPGSFMGELAQLSGRPALVDSQALTTVEAIVISPDRLRALLIAEAEIGERIMRALILRRVGLIETGSGGPVIVGRAGNGDVLRLVNFLTLRGDYLESGTPERFAEVIIRLEKEIFGKPYLVHPRTVRVKVGDPRDLRACMEAFGKDKRKCSVEVTDRLEAEMIEMLQAMRG